MLMSQYVEPKDTWLTRLPRCSNLKSNNVKGTIFQRRLVPLARRCVRFSSFPEGWSQHGDHHPFALPRCPLPHLWLHQRQWLRALQTPIKPLLPLSASMPCPAVLNPFLCLFMSCQSVLTVSLCLSWCDTKPCPTVRPCSDLSNLGAAADIYFDPFWVPPLFFHLFFYSDIFWAPLLTKPLAPTWKAMKICFLKGRLWWW